MTGSKGQAASGGQEQRRRAAPARKMTGFRDRLALWHACRAAPATGFIRQPEPRSIGSFARGRQILSGTFLFAGFMVEGQGLPIWDLPMPDARFEAALNGFTWLDDLAAVGGRPARLKAQEWTFGWIARFGTGKGPGWTPELTGRRLIRMVNHAALILNGRPREDADLFFRALGVQTLFLSRRFAGAAPGLPRFEALTGLVCAALALRGMEARGVLAAAALAGECGREIDPEGAIRTRNPEELLETLTLLIWAADALTRAGKTPLPEHAGAIARIAPVLRALRHTDGGLARFHGGGRGRPGRLDAALAESGSRQQPSGEGLAMGFARLHAGRSSIIVDAAAPPSGADSARAHASTLAFELTSGRRPLIVNCGSGENFGPDWARAGRATASHSTLALDGYSSSRLGREHRVGGLSRSLLVETPKEVWMRADEAPGRSAQFGHDGYVETHGLTHVRELTLSPDGALLRGEDTLGAMSVLDRRHLDKVLDHAGLQGIPYKIRFHLHPDVDARLDMGGWAVSMALRSGEIWVFRFDGPVELSLSPSVYLERGRLKPRATRQIVLSGRLLDHAEQISWTLEKAQDTPQPQAAAPEGPPSTDI